MAYRLSRSSKIHNLSQATLEQTKNIAGKSFFIRLLFAAACIFSLAACAATTEIPTENQSAMILPESLSFMDSSSEEKKLFEKGLAGLKSTPEHHPDYDASRKIFEAVIQQFPEGKWRKQAEIWLEQLQAFSLLEEELKACDQRGMEHRNQQERLQREIEQLNRQLRQVNEKNQEELNLVNQENEQLKRDIRLLRKMEIQRESRERMLR